MATPSASERGISREQFVNGNILFIGTIDSPLPSVNDPSRSKVFTSFTLAYLSRGETFREHFHTDRVEMSNKVKRLHQGQEVALIAKPQAHRKSHDNGIRYVDEVRMKVRQIAPMASR